MSDFIHKREAVPAHTSEVLQMRQV